MVLGADGSDIFNIMACVLYDCSGGLRLSARRQPHFGRDTICGGTHTTRSFCLGRLMAIDCGGSATNIKTMVEWDRQEWLWNKHLDRLANIVKIDAAKIWDARKQLIVVFGEEWLIKSQKALFRGNPITEKGVVGLITSPIENSAVEVVELAKYLKEFSNQGNFDEIVDKLRNASDFEAIRLNLAFAYRLSQSGAKDVYVEPPIGDIEAKISDQEYVVECSMIKPPQGDLIFANELLRSVLGEIRSGGCATWIDIEFKSIPKADQLSTVIKLVKKCNSQFLKTKGPAIEETSELRLVVKEANKLDIDSLPGKMEDEVWDFGFSVPNYLPRSPGDIYSVNFDEPPVRYDGMLTISGLINNDGLKSIYERLEMKLKKKRRQTKSVHPSKRRMFVFMSDKKVEDANWERIGKLFAEKQAWGNNIDAIIFVDRRHQTANDKLRYPSGQIHFSRTRLPHLDDLLASMKDFECSDWINE